MEIVSYVDGAAQTLVGNLGKLVGEEFRQLRGVGSEVAQLRDELATMNALLRMQSEADDGAVDHFVREWMKQLRELAYDAEDCTNLYMFRIRYSGVGRATACSSGPDTCSQCSSAPSPRWYGVNREALRRSPSLAPMPAASASMNALRPSNDPD